MEEMEETSSPLPHELMYSWVLANVGILEVEEVV